MSRLPLPVGNLTGLERSEERLRGIAYMVAAVFVFSIMDSLLKRLSTHYGPLQISCLRCISSWLFLLPPIGWQRTWAVFVGLGCVFMILHPWGQGSFSMIAASAAALATICYSLSALTVRTLGRSNSRMSMVFWYLLLVSIGAGVWAIGEGRPVLVSDWGWLIGIGVTGALGQMWLTDAFRRAPPSVVGPFEYTAILWAFAIDWIFWSASPSASLLIGACIVVASGIVVIVDERRLGQLAVNPAASPP